jgi:hypothetical protein
MRKHRLDRQARHCPANRRPDEAGFIAGPALYMLLLAGVGGAVVAGSQLEVMRGMMEMQNSVDAKQALTSAVKALSSEASTAASNVTPSAPDSGSDLTLADGLTLSDGGFTGGAIPAASGARKTDSWGQRIAYCASPPVSQASGSAAAIKIISGGPNRIIETSCAATAPAGDDTMQVSTVADTLNYASVFQPGATPGEITSGGQNVILEGNLTVNGTTALGGDTLSA